MGQILIESAIVNDNSGALASVINDDTSSVTILNTKVQGLANLGTHAFSGYPLVVGTDIPSKSESAYVANDNTGNLLTIINADTSTVALANGKLAGPLVKSITGNDGITVTNPTGVGAATLGLSGVANSALAGPLVSSVTAGTGINVSGNPTSGTGSPTISLSSGLGGTVLIQAIKIEEELTTTAATTVATYTPTATYGYHIQVFVRVVTAATTVTVTLTYYDAATTAHTDTLVPGTSLAVGAYDVVGSFVVAGSGGAIAVSVTAGTANQVYASAVIAQM